MRNIVIGLSWPYANNFLHLGHVASSLPADILARYHRMVGDKVLFVGGTDSHGNKPYDKAKQKGVLPIDIVNEYHQNFCKVFNLANMSFDLYAKTADEEHKKLVAPLFLKMYENGFIFEKIEKRPFCPKCKEFVQDNQIEITCPRCGNTAKADCCDNCGYIPTENDMKHARCRTCGGECVLKDNKVLVFKLSAFQKELQEYLTRYGKNWRANAVGETEKYLKDLQDRDFSRELKWGVEVPIPGYTDKKVYVWYEALMGYVTDVIRLCSTNGLNFDDFWKNRNGDNGDRVYMVHAKDNIPFHSVILPGMLLALRDDYKLPTHIVSCEYLTNKGSKISKTQGGFEALPWFENYNSDSLRYFFVANGPETKDADWSFELYKTVHNTEVVNKLGNLINRTLKFKGLNLLPDGEMDKTLYEYCLNSYKEVSEAIENIEFKKAINLVMDLVSFANKYYDEQKPWVQAKEENLESFSNTIYSCASVIANLSNFLYPFMPATAEKLKKFLKLDSVFSWEYITPKSGIELEVFTLFDRIA